LLAASRGLGRRIVWRDICATAIVCAQGGERQQTAEGCATEGEPMIKNYSDHAANERTFLAWLRTGLSVAAFGFVVQRFNLFLAEFARIMPPRPESPARLPRLVAPFGRYDGLALAVIGVVIIIVGTIHFVRISREIEDVAVRPNAGLRPELIISALLALLASTFCIYLALQ
jgi:putative membrane protein